MPRIVTLISLLFVFVAPVAVADELTSIIQQDLVSLGYDPGGTDGEMTTQTVIAISKFQAENDLEVNGQASPQLAGIIKAKLRQGAAPSAAASHAAPAPAASRDPAALQAAQQACLQQKMADAQAAQTKKRGFGSLMRAASRAASMVGGDKASRKIQKTSADAYAVDATAADLSSAAKDLGLTESDVEACRNPPM